MVGMDIPDEAVEAAAKVVLQYIDLQLLEHDQERKIPNEAAREILEAAAQYMLAAELDPELALEAATENYRQWLDEQQ